MMKKIGYISMVLILIVLSILPLILKSKTTAVFPKNIYCNVNFQHPIYEFKDSSGNSIFVLDENGNLYLNGTKVLFNQTGIAQPKTGFGLQVNSQLYWGFNNTNVNIYGEILQKQTIPNKPGDNDIIFRNPITKEPLAIFDGTTGDLKIKGLVIYNGYYDGMSVDDNAFNSNCTTIDNYNSSTGHDYYQDYYCNRINCVYRNIDLDLSQERCEGDNLNWNIGGNVNPTTCCGDDANEFNLTRKCNSGCTSDNSDDACCDSSNDAINGSTCYSEGSKICSPDNHNYVIESNSGRWNIFYNCTKQCFDSCNTFTTCNDGSCDSPNAVALGNHCSSGSGEIVGICNSNYACSNATGNMIYNNGGSLNCKATCDGSGGCSHATNCIDCSQPGSVNGCACACDGYGVQENVSNRNCDDGIDNDCDGKADNQDPDCCLDGDGDGWGTQDTYLNCPLHNSAPDCDDSHDTVYPGHVEVCNDGLDNDCDGKSDCADSDCVSACTFVIVNSRSGTCNTLCSNHAAVCLSIGLDSAGTNGRYCYYKNLPWPDSTCSTSSGSCTTSLRSDGQYCGGSYGTGWSESTHCRCRKLSGPAP